ncbi:hypothetical protein [Sneathiella litorea]|uniref:Uncharacterized protein n=1 Tax=Sneathiella litorea TaxID=2606216 RepID=A0A6L8W4K9_9PROT|nr:hypothetical protein [Sneathiella litorea]MZR29659.1 hypothetical protein [Sneathiella litorea]
MSILPKFDPFSELPNPGHSPAKVANPAKVWHETPQPDKRLATLAAIYSENTEPLDTGEIEKRATKITIVTPDNAEAKIIAWINSHPPGLPIVQNNCAECGEFTPVYDTGWVILGDGALIHYSGKHGKKCWKAWRRKRSNEAMSQSADG